jgi:putative DNA primase/helicase
MAQPVSREELEAMGGYNPHSATGVGEDVGAIDISRAEWRTDLANATRFLEQFAADVRWVPEWEKFLVWDGKRWALDHGERVESMAKEIAREVWTSVVDEATRGTHPQQLQAIIRFAKETASSRGVLAMLRLARSDARVVVHPRQLDADPWLLNVANGTLDLRTGELREHSRRDLLTKLCVVPYVEGLVRDGRTPAPLWSRAMLMMAAGDAELISFLQRLAGYWLTGSVRDHVLPIFYGTGANGKSVYLNALCDVLGPDYTMKAPPDLLMVKRGDAHPTERADLFGKRLVVAIETESGRRLAESLVKELTGGDKIRARRMREDFWEFEPTHKVVQAGNHKPKVRGTDNGIRRRLRLVPFTVTIPPDQQDKQLPEKLRKEREGILAWMVQGCREWQRIGLAEPRSVMAATDDYLSESDLLGQFIAECCIVEDRAWCEATSLFQHFCAWCEQNSERPHKRREFVKQMDDLGFSQERITSGPNKGRYIRTGIGLMASSEPVSEVG